MFKKKFIILQLIMSLVIFLSTIMFFAKIVSNFKPLYYYDVVNLNVEQDSGLNIATIKTNYSYVINFLNESSPSDFTLPTLTSSADAKIHFFEVHKIFAFMNYFLYFSLLFIIISIIITIKNKMYLYLKISGIALMALPLILIPILLTNFTEYFDDFHKILFRNNFWLFDPKNDPIILILPESFFLHCLIAIVLLSVIFGLILYILYRIIHKKTKYSYSPKYR